MYEKLNITENHLRLLALFAKGYQRSLYIRETQRMLGISPRTAQLLLDDLEQKGVLSSTTNGKIHSYRLQQHEIARHHMALAEEYQTIQFLRHYPVIAEIAEKILPLTNGISMLFGSYVKGSADEASDLDLFVAGTCNQEEMKQIALRYNIELSIKQYPLPFFKKKLWHDILIKEVLDQHIILSGSEALLREVMRHG